MFSTNDFRLNVCIRETPNEIVFSLRALEGFLNALQKSARPFIKIKASRVHKLPGLSQQGAQTARIKASRVHKLSGLMWATRACDFVMEGFLSIRSRGRLPAQTTALKTRAPPHGAISYFSP